MPKWVESNDIKKIFIFLFTAVCGVAFSLIAYIYTSDRAEARKNHSDLIRVVSDGHADLKKEMDSDSQRLHGEILQLRAEFIEHRKEATAQLRSTESRLSRIEGKISGR